MNRITAIIIKIVFTVIAGWIAFDLFMENPFGTILVLGIVAAIVNYVLGDMVILDRFGNIAASIADGIVAGIIALIFSAMVDAFDVDFGSVLFFIVLIALAEFIFHKYLVRDND